jgi:hypothetical protein
MIHRLFNAVTCVAHHTYHHTELILVNYLVIIVSVLFTQLIFLNKSFYVSCCF